MDNLKSSNSAMAAEIVALQAELERARLSGNVAAPYPSYNSSPRSSNSSAPTTNHNGRNNSTEFSHTHNHSSNNELDHNTYNTPPYTNLSGTNTKTTSDISIL